MPFEISDDQSEVFTFLSDPATHGLARDAQIKRIETHGAIVFLAGADVYKVKRAVRFPFMDFSTLEKRQAACENEIRVNRDNAPSLYLGTVAVRRSPNGLRLGGETGDIIEWSVHMRRFDETATFDHLADRGELGVDLIAQLADIVAVAHARAPMSDVEATSDLRYRLLETLDGLAAAPDIFAAPEVADLREHLTDAFTAAEGLLRSREAQGKVRRCHGDLHLRNIVLFEARPVLFDAIEFDDAVATCDILYDLAFLIMDLWQRGLEDETSLLFNRYLWRCDTLEQELAGLAALPLFLALRAAIRARVTAHLIAFQSGGRRELVGESRHFFAAARAFLAPRSQHLVAIGGFSGSGKSTLAQRLAAAIGRAPGAVHLRSDIERKRLSGAGEFERLPAAAYRPEVSDKTYDRLRHLAEAALAAGQSVIVDAVHAKPEERDAIAAVAARAGATFIGLWLDAPVDVLVSRVASRGPDASDADAAVVKRQAAGTTGTMTWTCLQAGAPLERLAQDALALIASERASGTRDS